MLQEDWKLVPLIDRMKQRDVFADDFFGSIAIKSLSSFVPTGDVALQILADDGVFRGLDNRRQFRPHLFRLSALSDVAVIGDDGLNAWLGQQVCPGAFQPAPGIVFMPKAKAVGDALTRLGDQPGELPLDALQILGVQELEKVVADELFRGVAEDANG